jgi:hypothetical protein
MLAGTAVFAFASVVIAEPEALIAVGGKIIERFKRSVVVGASNAIVVMGGLTYFLIVCADLHHKHSSKVSVLPGYYPGFTWGLPLDYRNITESIDIVI